MSNNITITGRLAQDPELRFGQSGKAFCNISVPDQKRRKNDQGQWEDASATTWFRVTVFDEAAEALAEHSKGDEVIVTGRLITREYQKSDGTTGSSLEVDYAKVAVVPGGGRVQRQQQPQGDAWGQPAQSGWGQQAPAQQGGAGDGFQPPF